MWKIRNKTNGSVWTGEAWTPFPQDCVELGVVTLDDTYEMVRMQDTRKQPGVFEVGDKVAYTDRHGQYSGMPGTVISIEGGKLEILIDSKVYRNQNTRTGTWISDLNRFKHVEDT